MSKLVDAKFKIVKTKLVSSGVRSLLKSDDVMQELEKVSSSKGTIDSTWRGRNRCNVRYIPK